jgi:hypothetical protein
MADEISRERDYHLMTRFDGSGGRYIIYEGSIHDGKEIWSRPYVADEDCGQYAYPQDVRSKYEQLTGKPEFDPNWGDYPGLDFGGNPSQKSAPTGWRKKAPLWGLAALLIAVVVMMVSSESFGFGAIIPMAENQPSRFSKSILVFDASPYINKPYSISISISPKIIQGWRSPLHATFRGDQNSTAAIRYDGLKGVFVAVLRQRNTDITSNTFSGQISPINNGDMRDDAFVGHLMHTARFDAQISSLQNFSLAVLSQKQTQLTEPNCDKQTRKDGDRFPPFFPLFLVVVGGASFCFFYWLTT